MQPSECYPPIGDYALIGDCHSAALVSRRTDRSTGAACRASTPAAPSAGCSTAERGGHCSITPTGDGPWEYARSYVDDTLVLETTLHGPAGEARLLDCFALRDDTDGTDARRILRVIEGVRGSVEVELRVAPRFDYGQVRPWIRRHGHRLHSTIGGNDALLVWCEHGARRGSGARARRAVRGRRRRPRPARADLLRPRARRRRAAPEPEPHALDEQLEETLRVVARVGRVAPASARAMSRRRAARGSCSRRSRTRPPARSSRRRPRRCPRRSAARATGTTATRGCATRASARARWPSSARSTRPTRSARSSCARPRATPRISRSSTASAASADSGATSSRGSRDTADRLRSGVGNDASGQLQLDAYGELVNLTWRWHRRGHSPSDDDWRFLVSLIDHAAERWSEPDCGIWEWPGDPEHFVHSKVLCWSALDRGIRLADECMRRAPIRRWKQARDEVRETIERRGYDRKRGVLRAGVRPPASWTRRCCCCRRSSTSPGTTSGCCERSRPCARSSTPATG